MSNICPICQKSIVTIFDTDLDLYFCAHCTHEFARIRRDEHETYAPDYFEKTHRNWFENPDYSLFDDIYKKLVYHLGQDAFHLLDIGCGTGVFLKYLLTKNTQMMLSGIDLKKNVHPHIRFFQGDVETFKFEERYEAITMLAVIEHLPDPVQTLDKILRLLKPGGILAIMTVNTNSLLYNTAKWLHRLNMSNAFNRLYERHHLQHFSDKSLIQALQQAGFDIIHTKNHNISLKAIDYPTQNQALKTGYKLAVRSIFSIAEKLNKGYLQTIICRKT